MVVSDLDVHAHFGEAETIGCQVRYVRYVDALFVNDFMAAVPSPDMTEPSRPYLKHYFGHQYLLT